jgi:hypothetical protein
MFVTQQEVEVVLQVIEEVRDRRGPQASKLAAKQMVSITAARSREQKSHIFKYTTVPPFLLSQRLCL